MRDLRYAIRNLRKVPVQATGSAKAMVAARRPDSVAAARCFGSKGKGTVTASMGSVAVAI